jgi:hypothetical protein
MFEFLWENYNLDDFAWFNVNPGKMLYLYVYGKDYA